MSRIFNFAPHLEGLIQHSTNTLPFLNGLTYFRTDFFNNGTPRASHYIIPLIWLQNCIFIPLKVILLRNRVDISQWMERISLKMELKCVTLHLTSHLVTKLYLYTTKSYSIKKSSWYFTVNGTDFFNNETPRASHYIIPLIWLQNCIFPSLKVILLRNRVDVSQWMERISSMMELKCVTLHNTSHLVTKLYLCITKSYSIKKSSWYFTVNWLFVEWVDNWLRPLTWICCKRVVTEG